MKKKKLKIIVMIIIIITIIIKCFDKAFLFEECTNKSMYMHACTTQD